MKDYFTISEFAKLRNLNINSLRYYEKLGLLTPAYLDPNTNYRYYRAEQLSILDKIILCIDLGIPLKEAASYIDENGSFHSQKLLERGRSETLRRIRALQNTLNFIDFSLHSIEAGKQFADHTGHYIRRLEQRRIITSDRFIVSQNVKEFLSEVSKLYRIAQEKQLFPILPAGQLVEQKPDGTIRFRLFLQIMEQETPHPAAMLLPAGSYSCIQLDLNTSETSARLLEQTMEKELTESHAEFLIIDNVALEKYSFGSRLTEIQRLLP